MKPLAALPPLHWTLFAAAAMALGWGLRGFIGGGPLGAMIPGAMIGLVIALLLRTDANQTSRLIAFAAVGIGFGGDMTYGQTVGLAMKPETFTWALLGFAIKGAVWGLLGGAIIALALASPPRGYLAVTMAAMVAATWLGWRVVNEPKLIYFSNLLDRPRPEVWAGLLLAGVTVAAMNGAIARRFALCGAVGGGIGFALGAWFQVLGRAHGTSVFSDWWKVMELAFGALLGASYAWAAWSVEPAPQAPEEPSSSSVISTLTAAALAVAIALFFVPVIDRFHIRFSYTIAGALLLLLATRSPAMARQIGITVTCCAFFLDLYEDRPQTDAWLAILLIFLATAAVAFYVLRTTCPVLLFLLIMWTAVADSLLKSYLPGPRQAAHAVQAIFVVLAIVCTLYRDRFQAPPEPIAH